MFIKLLAMSVDVDYTLLNFLNFPFGNPCVDDIIPCVDLISCITIAPLFFPNIVVASYLIHSVALQSVWGPTSVTTFTFPARLYAFCRQPWAPIQRRSCTLLLKILTSTEAQRISLCNIQIICSFPSFRCLYYTHPTSITICISNNSVSSN